MLQVLVYAKLQTDRQMDMIAIAYKNKVQSISKVTCFIYTYYKFIKTFPTLQNTRQKKYILV